MLKTLNTPVIGATNRKLLWVPGAISIGGTSSQPVISPIDLLSQELDGRLSYTGPSHSYVASDNTLKQSLVNEWPLEYRNGVAVGRHEPEKATRNYVPGVEFASRGPTGSTPFDWNYGKNVASVIESDMGLASATTTTTGVLTAVYSEGISSFIAPAIDGGFSDEWKRIKRQFTNTSPALLRWYVARVDSNDYLLARCGNVPVGDFTASVFRKVTADNLLSAGAQLESGSIATSPVISPTNVQQTRAASSVVIDTALSQSVTVYYSDGTKDDHVTPDNSFTIPASQKNWGERYMQRIEFK